MYRAGESAAILSPRSALIAAAFAAFLFPLLASHLALIPTSYIPLCQAQPQGAPDSRSINPAWREIGPWEQLAWISKMAPRRGALLTEDSVMKLLKELATVGTPEERKDFLRQELREGLVKRIAESNQELRRMTADVFILGAIDSLERGEYVQAESFLRGSKVLYPNLESQRVIEREIRRRYWEPEQPASATEPFLFIGLGVLGSFFLFIVLFGRERQEIVIPPPPEYVRDEAEVSAVHTAPSPVLRKSDVSATTEAEGLARTDAAPLADEIEVRKAKADLDDIFKDPDAAVGDLVDFDFAAGSQRKND